MISQHDDTTFVRPNALAVDPGRGHIYVADTWAFQLVVLDATTGRVLRTIGREGDGPGELRSATLLALPPARNRIWVLDLAGRRVDIFDTSGASVRRQVLPGALTNPKDMLVIDDSSAFVAAALRDAEPALPVHQVTLAGGELRSSGPPIPGAELRPTAITRRARGVIGGAALAGGSDRLYLAESATGDVWDISGGTAQLVARGPGPAEDLFERAVVFEPRRTTFWWFYPKAIYLEVVSADEFVVGWSERDERRLTFFRAVRGRRPEVIATLDAFPVYAIERYDNDSFVYITTGEGGVAAVGRRRFPAELRRE